MSVYVFSLLGALFSAFCSADDGARKTVLTGQNLVNSTIGWGIAVYCIVFVILYGIQAAFSYIHNYHQPTLLAPFVIGIISTVLFSVVLYEYLKKKENW